MNNSYIPIYHVNVTQTVPDISPLMPMHQDPLLGGPFKPIELTQQGATATTTHGL